MPTFDDKSQLFRDNQKHVIVVYAHVRDDESIVYEPKCLCGSYIPGVFPVKEEAACAGEHHKRQI